MELRCFFLDVWQGSEYTLNVLLKNNVKTFSAAGFLTSQLYDVLDAVLIYAFPSSAFTIKISKW